MAYTSTQKPKRNIKRANQTSSEMMLNETFYANTANGAVRRIRTPGKHDVLSGRGGSVNAHPGNHQFRDWVAVRRVDYNLAHSKQDKAAICREVIAQVEELGGRFLGRETPSSQFWVELDDERIMAKTSQALREGAPKIREEHKEELGAASKTKRRRSSARAVKQQQKSLASETEPPEQPKRRFAHEEESTGKRVRVEHNGYIVRPNQETPPLTSQPAPEMDHHMYRSNDQLLMPAPEHQHPQPSYPPAPRSGKLNREHSLAFSDISGFDSTNYGDLSTETFVNPFEDESEWLSHLPSRPPVPQPDQQPDIAVSGTTESLNRLPSASPPPRLGVIRDTSNFTNHSNHSDMAGLGSLMNSNSDSSKQSVPSLGALLSTHSSSKSSNKNNNGVRSMLRRSSSGSGGSNLSSRYAQNPHDDGDDDGYDADRLMGLPLFSDVWNNDDWFQSIPVSP